MSFRSRLLIFFTIIVVIPMIAVALVLFKLTEDSEHGKVDARLAGGLQTTLSFYEEARDQARPPARRLASDDALLEAYRARDGNAIDSRLRALGGGVESVTYYPPDGGRPIAPIGNPTVAAATVGPTTADGE